MPCWRLAEPAFVLFILRPWRWKDVGSLLGAEEWRDVTWIPVLLVRGSSSTIGGRPRVTKSSDGAERHKGLEHKPLRRCAQKYLSRPAPVVKAGVEDGRIVKCRKQVYCVVGCLTWRHTCLLPHLPRVPPQMCRRLLKNGRCSWSKRSTTLPMTAGGPFGRIRVQRAPRDIDKADQAWRCYSICPPRSVSRDRWWRPFPLLSRGMLQRRRDANE
jgi:hypothetical protein